MRRLFVGIVLGMASQCASAQWVKITENDQVITYANQSTLSTSGNVVNMWLMTDFKKARNWPDGRTVLSSKWQKEFDCKNSRVRDLAILFYTGRGGAGNTVHSDFDPKGWEPVPPDTQIEDIWRYVCRRR